jgi:hypothetical protein
MSGHSSVSTFPTPRGANADKRAGNPRVLTNGADERGLRGLKWVAQAKERVR